MGSIESGRPWKRENSSLRSSFARHTKLPSVSKRRSRFQKLFLANTKCIRFFLAISFLAFVVGLFCFLFQLPGTTVEKSETRLRGYGDSNLWKEIDQLDYGNGFKLEPSKVLAKFQKDSNKSSLTREGVRLGFRKPQLAFVLHDLQPDPEQLLMVTLVNALRTIGYEIEVYSPEDGPVFAVWQHMGINVTIVKTSEKDVVVDWLKYEGVIINSIEGREFFSRLLQEPFKSIPLIWSIHDRSLGTHLKQYKLNGQIKLENDWRRFFNRSTVVVFPNYALPIFYSAWDVGNYFVIPGTPAEAWEADKLNVPYKDNPRAERDDGPNSLVIAVVGSQFSYRGLWLEHSIILKALSSVTADLASDSSSHLKIIISSGETSGNYSAAIETIARNLEYPENTVRHVGVDEDDDSILRMADLVIYGSFLEEKSFPSILIKSMCFGKPVIAPDLSMIRKYIDHRVNGYLFPKDNIKVLTSILKDVISAGKLSSIAQNIALTGKGTAKNLMVSETVEGYAFLLENILKLPSEVTPPKAITEIPSKLKEEWQWEPFESIPESTYQSTILRRHEFLERIEEQWNSSQKEIYNAASAKDDVFLYSIWEEEKSIDMANTRKRREDEELKDRTEQPRGTYEDVYRNVKKAERSKSELHERDEGELERTGQPLCIYEPYFGEGTWPFLHHTSLYRGIGLSTRGRRPETDDIDAPSRLPLLSNPYYRDALGEFGAFFAIANRVDRIHKNAWIGFQSWRATARKESLSKAAETALLNAIEARKHGDALYFWSRMDVDPREQLTKDFWSFCDASNAGNCKFAFSGALKKMYGVKHNRTFIPPMPIDGDTWSVKHNWALPTKSFLEFVMFSRMFIDALDAQFYDEHSQSGHCYLSLSKDKHCYSRVLELLVNVWAFHSARRMVYVNPETGDMQSQHKMKNRRGHMWVKWFSYTTLKSMDEDMAEEYDYGSSKRRWLWPSTGEVFWRGMFERERNQRNKEKEKRKQSSRDKILRMKKRYKQKAIGKYVKPLPEEDEGQGSSSNSTTVEVKLLR